MPNDDQVKEIMTKMSDLMGVEITFVQDTQDQGRVIPAYDVNGIFSKMIALCVYSSLNVPSTFAPPYNRVHADIEWWKKHFECHAAAPAKVVEEIKSPTETVAEEKYKLDENAEKPATEAG